MSVVGDSCLDILDGGHVEGLTEDLISLCTEEEEDLLCDSQDEEDDLVSVSESTSARLESDSLEPDSLVLDALEPNPSSSLHSPDREEAMVTSSPSTQHSHAAAKVTVNPALCQSLGNSVYNCQKVVMKIGEKGDAESCSGPLYGERNSDVSPCGGDLRQFLNSKRRKRSKPCESTTLDVPPVKADNKQHPLDSSPIKMPRTVVHRDFPVSIPKQTVDLSRHQTPQFLKNFFRVRPNNMELYYKTVSQSDTFSLHHLLGKQPRRQTTFSLNHL